MSYYTSIIYNIKCKSSENMKHMCIILNAIQLILKPTPYDLS